MARIVAALRSVEPPVPVTLHFSRQTQATQRPIVVISHHFGGNEQTSHRHVELFNKLGFDCATFLFSDPNPLSKGPNRKLRLPFGLYRRWRLELDQVLAQIPAREKILLSFSGPAASALELIAAHLAQGRYDLVGFICDSGPFVDARTCTRNMLEQLYGIKNALARETLLELMMLMWGLGHDRSLLGAARAIVAVAPEFPILSFRGTLDLIVPAKKIGAVFDALGFKNLTVANLETGHLTGLKEMPELYERVITPFLKAWTAH